MNDKERGYVRLRYTATGAVAALAAAGAIAGTAALAAKPGATAHARAATAKRLAKTPSQAPPDKTKAPEPPVNHQPFFDVVGRLVADGTITAPEAQAVESEIQAGRVDTDTLAAAGFTPTQLQAVQQALAGAKQALAAQAPRPSK